VKTVDRQILAILFWGKSKIKTQSTIFFHIGMCT
jgi:hypothetical protein